MGTHTNTGRGTDNSETRMEFTHDSFIISEDLSVETIPNRALFYGIDITKGRNTVSKFSPVNTRTTRPQARQPLPSPLPPPRTFQRSMNRRHRTYPRSNPPPQVNNFGTQAIISDDDVAREYLQLLGGSIDQEINDELASLLILSDLLN